MKSWRMGAQKRSPCIYSTCAASWYALFRSFARFALLTGASENILPSNHPSVGSRFKYSNRARGCCVLRLAWAQFCVSRDVIILLRGWAVFYWLFMACSPHDGGVPHLFESTIPQRCTQREKSAWFWQHSSFIDWRRSTRCWKFVTRSGEATVI